MPKLEGKNVLITGATGGIGRATALRLARDGAAIAAHFRGDREGADRLVAEVRAGGGAAQTFAAELAEPAQVRRLFADANASLGGLDIVAHIAGAGLFKPHAAVEDEELERLIGANVRAGFYVLQEAARRVRDGGRIVAVSVAGTVMPVPGSGLNNGSRAAVDQMALALAKELGPRNITVNVVALGMIDTAALAATVPEALRQQVSAETPLGRLGRPEEVAGTLAFLAGPDAGFISGQVIRVTGGLV